MTAFATFGNITFEIVGSFETVTFEDRTHYAKIDVIGAPPTLQWIYDDLTTIKFDIKLHKTFSDPEEAILALRDQRISHSPAAFTIGSDNKGNYIITRIEQTDLWRGDDGTIIAAQLKVELLQWAGELPQNAPQVPGQSTAIGLTSTDQASISPLLIPVAAALSAQQALVIQALATSGLPYLTVPGLPVLGPFGDYLDVSLILATRM
jgi:hypothetical protein